MAVMQNSYTLRPLTVWHCAILKFRLFMAVLSVML
jgi:hypothetical protein